MASCMRLAGISRRSNHLVQCRKFTSTTARRNDLGTAQVQKKPIGGFRGGIIGFLFGFSLASSFAAYHLLEEYQRASAALQTSIEELKVSTEKVSAHVRRIEAVEKDLKALSDASASKEDVSRVRAEVKKIYDGLHIEFLDLRAYVWGMQQDIHKLLKKESESSAEV